MRALAKVPADRFPTAADFAEALASAARGDGRHRPRRPALRGRRRMVALAAAGLGLVARSGGIPPVAAPEAVALDPNLVAVVPFRVRGAAPALGYLREGMIDLVAARLTGEGGARAADPGLGDGRVAAGRGLRGGRSPRARRARPGPPARRRPAPARGRRGHARSRGAQRLAAPGRRRGPAGRGEGRRRGGQPAPAGGPADRPAHHRGERERPTGSTAWSTRRSPRCGSTSRPRRRSAAAEYADAVARLRAGPRPGFDLRDRGPGPRERRRVDHARPERPGADSSAPGPAATG